MSCAPIYATVQDGPYAGFTLVEMRAEFDRYKEALTTGAGDQLIGTSVNGDSLQFGPRADWSLNEWGRQVRWALSQVSADVKPPRSSTVGFTFTSD